MLKRMSVIMPGRLARRGGVGRRDWRKMAENKQLVSQLPRKPKSRKVFLWGEQISRWRRF